MILIYSNYKKRKDIIIMKKRLISFMLLITVISCVGFNTDYFKNLLTLISQAAKEVIYEETERYDEETTDSAVDSLEQELEKLDVRNFFEDESETESGSSSINLPEYDGKTTHGVLVLEHLHLLVEQPLMLNPHQVMLVTSYRNMDMFHLYYYEKQYHY